MHGNKNNDGGNIWVPSDRYERYSGPNKEIREQYKREMWERERQEHEGKKPNTQMFGSSATGASSSRSKNK